MFEAFASLLVYQWLGLDPANHSGAALHFFVMDTTKIFFLLFIIIYIMGLLRAMLSPEKVREYVRGKPKWLARTLAIILGAVTPFCSCSSVPLFIGFVEAGIPLGVTFSFLIASPMINEVAAVILVGILGWKLAALYIGAGLLVAYVGGVIMEYFKPERWVEDYVWKIQMGETQVIESDNSLFGRHRFAIGEVKEIVSRIWKWVFAGVALGALFSARCSGTRCTFIFQCYRCDSAGRSHAGQRCSYRHDPGTNDEHRSPFITGNAHPAKSYPLACPRYLRICACCCFHSGGLDF